MFKRNKNIIKLIMVILSSLLAGCVSVATSGAQAVYNHQSIQRSVQDQYITMRAYQVLDIETDQFKHTNINVSTLNRVVLLSGQVDHNWQKQAAEKLVQKIPGVTDVYNWISVDHRSTPLDHARDAWLTAKVKAQLIASDDVDASQIKVVTENGTVFLMGVLTPQEAQVAAVTASHTQGVRQVVKIFSYLKISKSPV
jgi:osmotically-inducible protein OsmY